MTPIELPLLRETAAGVIIPVRARPGARRTGVVGVHDGCWKLAVAQPPDGGRANEALIELLATVLDLPVRQIQLIQGQTSPKKSFLVGGRSAREIQDRLAATAKHA